MSIVPAGGLFQARLQAALAAGLTLVLSLIMLGHFHRGFAGPQFVEHAGWATQVGLDWTVWVDGISIWLIMLTTVLFTLAVAYLCFRTPERPRAFLAPDPAGRSRPAGALFALATWSCSTCSGSSCSSRSIS